MSRRHTHHNDAPSGGRACETPECDAPGEFRAPKSRDELMVHRWFCLEHIRQYNANWNYYQGMSDQEVEADVKRDTRWQRPSWRLGTNGGTRAGGGMHSEFFDPLGLFGKTGGRWASHGAPGNEADPFRGDTDEAKALAIMDLEAPLTEKKLKARYKTLVKRHHPDTNNGDKGAEEMFKQITQAYQTLLGYLSRSSRPRTGPPPRAA